LVTTDARVSTGSRRSAIVDAAEALILRDGIDGVRAQRLADQAGISIATPYYYFESLDAAVEAVQARASERLATARAAAVQAAGDDPLDQLRALLTSDFAGPTARVRSAWLLRLEFQRRAIFDASLREGVRAGEQAALDLLTELVAAGQSTTAIPADVPAARLAARLLSLSCGLGALLLVDMVTPQRAAALLDDAVDDRDHWRSSSSPHTPPEVPADVPAADRATAILDETIALIAEAGVAGVHYRAVAERAGTSLSLPRYYFPTIRELISAAFARDLEVAQSRMAPAAAPEIDALARLAYVYMPAESAQLAARRPTLVLWFEFLRLGEGEPKARAVGRARLQGWLDYSTALAGELVAAGLVPADRATRERAERLIAVNTGASGLWLIGLIADAEFAAVMNGVIDDESGRLV
jgi:AcrR family transcriptional regulator